MSFFIILGVCLFFVSLMFKSTWLLLGKAAVVGFIVLKWTLVVGILFGILNTPQAYHAMGWTPMSVLVGDHLYAKYAKK